MSQTIRTPGPERRVHPRKGMIDRLRNLLFGLLRWIGRYVKGFHAAVGTFLAMGMVVALLLLWGFAGLAEWVAEGRTQSFDDAVLLWLNERATPWLTVAALEVTALGAGLVVWMVVAVASAFLWVSRHRYSVALLWVAALGATGLNSILKALFDRPRPDLFPWRAPYAGQSSFPSGHAMTAMVVYLTLAYLVARLEPTPLLRRLTLASTAVVILLIGLSRMYLGVHFPTDVIAGYLAGFVWAVFCALGIEAVRYFRRRRPGVERVEEDLDAERERELGVRA
ncbi:MAG TPA: phosphatase PAP2 family protein [Longimicrobiaceae bacterium]|nr:phosphatase PAP2 family protein [Longimicrobiaceae bacterium]